MADDQAIIQEEMADNCRRAFIVELLFILLTGDRPRWFHGGILFKLCYRLPPAFWFADEKQFRMTMAEMVDNGLVVELNGKTLAEPSLDKLNFTLSKFAQILLRDVTSRAGQGIGLNAGAAVQAALSADQKNLVQGKEVGQ